jgi:hypothetical protein
LYKSENYESLGASGRTAISPRYFTPLFVFQTACRKKNEKQAVFIEKCKKDCDVFDEKCKNVTVFCGKYGLPAF